VLFVVEDGSGRVAVVHLTWHAGQEVLTWPIVTLYDHIMAWEAAARQAEAGARAARGF
jgi:hypothetical protein